MKKLINFSKAAFLFFLIGTSVFGQALYVEDFNYPVGDSLTNHGWTQIRPGTPITISAPGLIYTDYSSSGIGNAASLVSTGEQEVKNIFTEQTSDSVYISYLINVSNASTTGGLYLYLGPTNISIFNRRLTAYIQKDISDNIRFGISKNSGVSYTGYDYSLNTTYLVVMKYKFNSNVNDDEVGLWIDPQLSGLEPTPDVTSSEGDDATSIAEIALSQLTASNEPPDASIDGIRIATSWANAPLPVEDNSIITERKYQLGQNYPNPFNSSTKISYSIPKSDYVNLKIYDLLGREVQTLVNEFQVADNYKVNFDAGKFSSGTYFYKLQTGSFVEVKKMLYLR